MAIEIKLQNVPHYRTSIVLDSVNYLLDFDWSTRGKCWYMNVFTSESVPIIYGIKLCNMTEMIHRYSRKALPSGYLLPMFTNNFDVSRRIEENDVPNNVSLFYMNETEFNQIMSL